MLIDRVCSIVQAYVPLRNGEGPGVLVHDRRGVPEASRLYVSGGYKGIIVVAVRRSLFEHSRTSDVLYFLTQFLQYY